MKKLMIIAGLLICSSAKAAVVHNGHYYALTSPGSWNEANDEAIAMGGYLVTVNNQHENDFLVSFFTHPDFIYDEDAKWQQLWIGYTDEAQEGVWVWSGKNSSYTNWMERHPGVWEPTNGYPRIGEENYACIQNDGFWNDYNNTMWTDMGFGDLQGIVEMNHNPVHCPAPGAFVLVGIGLSILRRIR